MIDNNRTCMDDYDPDSLLLSEAVERVLASVDPIQERESVDLLSALGRVNAQPLTARIDVPSFCCSAMDGFAFRYADYQSEHTEFTIIGKSLAGHPFADEVPPGCCIAITTGAALPVNTDTIVMQENALQSSGMVRFPGSIKQGQFARVAGSDSRAGDSLFETNQRLKPADIGLLASQGFTHLDVRRKPRVAVVSTGDELIQGGAPLEHAKIYDSNRPLLISLLAEEGIDAIDIGTAGDNIDAIQDAFDQATKQADIIISSGGVSVGEADFVRALLAEHGQIHFWKIAMKPGRPLTLARYKGVPFFGLPGNPVSVAVTFTQFVKPALRKLAGVDSSTTIIIKARATGDFKKSAGRMEFQRGILSADNDGELIVSTTGLQDSHLLSSLSRANCYVVLPLESSGAQEGEQVCVQLSNTEL